MVHYRAPLFERMSQLCASLGIDLEIFYGQPSQLELKRGDSAELPGGIRTHNRHFTLFDQELVWQALPGRVRSADLIVMSQENRILSNYSLLLRNLFRRGNLAFWGHGRNFQSSHANGFRETWKKFILGKVDWWFTYTELSAHVMADMGVPEGKITVLNNSIDSRSFKRDLNCVSHVRLAQLRHAFGIGLSAPVGLYCGTLNDEKRLDALVLACDRIREVHGDFQLFVLGDGPGVPFLVEAFQSRPGMHYVGEKRGIEKAEYFKLAQVVLNPGLVGLCIVDAFCAGLPLITMAGSKHSPEIAYLKNDVNGIMTENDVSIYADRIIELLADEPHRRALSINALVASEHYSIENMAANFVQGIKHCLARNGTVPATPLPVARRESN